MMLTPATMHSSSHTPCAVLSEPGFAGLVDFQD